MKFLSVQPQLIAVSYDVLKSPKNVQVNESCANVHTLKLNVILSFPDRLNERSYCHRNILVPRLGMT